MNSEKKNLLRQQRLFALADETVLEHASNMLRIVQFKAGDYICFQGDPVAPLALVFSGQLRTSTISEDGSEVPVRTVEAGHSAGEPPIIHGLPIMVNIAATRKSTVAIIQRADARELLAEPSLSRALNTALAFQLYDLVERHTTQGLPRADSRISAVIASAMGGTKADASPLIELPNQATIAAMAKVSRETVSRVLKSLEHRGVIAKEGRQIRVCDRSRLHSLAAG
jgi:CRP-like cAMP-binding protein